MTKRDFYVDDELIINKPGVNTEISPELKAQEGSHGEVSFIEGMSIRTTPILEKYANQARNFIHEKWSLYGAELETQKSAVVNEFHSISNTIQLSIKEPVLPGLIYVLTGTLTGSILVNRRSLPIRFITPLIFGGVSLSYFMPRTYETIAGNIENLEKESVPEVYNAHKDLLRKYDELKNDTEEGATKLQSQLISTVHDARVNLINLLSDEKKK